MAILLTQRPNNLTEYPNSFKRQGAFPLESTSCWYSLSDATKYAKENPTAYVGQIITVIENKSVKHYSIEDEAGTLKELGTSSGDNPGGGSTDVDLSNYYTKDEVDDLIDGFVVEIPSEYVTEEELTNKQYITEQAFDGIIWDCGTASEVI